MRLVLEVSEDRFDEFRQERPGYWDIPLTELEVRQGLGAVHVGVHRAEAVSPTVMQANGGEPVPGVRVWFLQAHKEE